MHFGASVRPGLVPDRLAKKLERDKKEKEANIKSKTKPLKVIEHEKREEGLGNALGTENKGFALLQKMGYKEGMSLGKEGKGRKEPVPVELKLGRGGLGRDAEMKRKHIQIQSYREVMKAKRAKYAVQQQKDFRQRMAGLLSEKRVHGDLMKSQRVCEQLDTEKKGLKQPLETFFWPEALLKPAAQDVDFGDVEDDDDDKPSDYYQLPPDEEKEDEGEQPEPEEEECNLEEPDQLAVLTEYLRSTYFYCLWCGITYNDSEDLEDNCPGDTSTDHD
ncbi:G patch domain-containing protein 11-like isoform X2 [Lineus longissimus]|uniref:G patch domain-containing protein 11-like isoform X2 n=1 Tax=Lineus longissimus TaxID=88925 RepID=UPI002B4C7A7E